MTKLKELCQGTDALGSKNVKQWYTTFDMFFNDRQTYEKVKKSGVLNEKLFTKLYGSPVTHFTWYDEGYALKVTIKRKRLNGNVGDPDVYSNGQSYLLWDIDIPI